METVEIYWNNLTEDMQQELLEAGLSDANVIDGVFPVSTVFVGGGTI